MAKNKRNSNKKGLGVPVIIALITVIALIIVFNNDFVNSIKDKIVSTTQTDSSEDESFDFLYDEIDETKKDDVKVDFVEAKEPTPQVEEKPLVIKIKEPAKTNKVVKTEIPASIEKTLTTKKTRKKLYFIKYNVNDESYILQPVTRLITYEHSILKQTLNILLYGPKGSEISANLTTLIQPETELGSVSLSNGIAYLDFNEDFMYHELGRDGFITQLKQIVFTSTEFATVDSVQILINGKKRDYTPENVNISMPFNRNSF